MQHDPHIPDEELIQAIDNELSPTRLAQVHRHISHCWRCRTRRGELEHAIANFVGLHKATLDQRIPSGDAPFTRFRKSIGRSESPPVWKRHWMALACSGLLLVVSAAIVVSFSRSRTPDAFLPDSRLTPGATRLISKEQVCAVSSSDEDRQVSVELASRVFRDYGIQPLPRAYEVDYLITPALGGADDIRNLWPQPYENGMWTARVKDALEDYLRSLVCDGRLDLATAQHEIATDWIASYRKHFHTDRPVPAHALFVKDRPWE